MRRINRLVERIVYPSKYYYVNQYKNIDTYSFDELENIRYKKLVKLVRHFYSFPFYRNLCRCDISELDSIDKITILPYVDKQFIRKNLHLIRNMDRSAVLRSTSGSTGENFSFYVTRMRRAAASAALHDFMRRIGALNRPGKTVGIWGGNLHKPGESRVINRLKNMIQDTVLLPGYGLNEEISVKYLEILKKIKPVVLYGYPTYLDTLARYGIKNNIEPYTPDVIVASGEQLTDNARRRIEQYFGKRIYNRYGSVEFSVIGHEICEDEGMYINPLRFIVETDADGELIITDLDNYATPFIRYRIGDLGSLSRKGNWIILESLQGRANDVIVTGSGRIIPSQFFTILSKTVDGIEQYQFVQESESVIEMRIIPGSGFEPDAVSKIKRLFEKNYGSEIRLDVKITDRLERTRSGKHKFVIKKSEV